MKAFYHFQPKAVKRRQGRKFSNAIFPSRPQKVKYWFNSAMSETYSLPNMNGNIYYYYYYYYSCINTVTKINVNSMRHFLKGSTSNVDYNKGCQVLLCVVQPKTTQFHADHGYTLLVHNRASVQYEAWGNIKISCTALHRASQRIICRNKWTAGQVYTFKPSNWVYP